MTNEHLMVQKLTKNTLKVFIKFCEENNLTYFFTGGSLIGVIRHNGFIPWDDDIDIVMPRKDFDTFHKLMKTNGPKGYGLCTRHSDRNWHFALSQFIDLESVIEIDLAEKKRKAHIWVDIFPLDGLPSNSFVRWFRVSRILYYRYLVQIAHISTQVDSHRSRPWYEKAVLRLFTVLPIGKIINTNKSLDRLEKVLRKTDFYESKYCGNMLSRYRRKEVIPTKWIGNPATGLFDGEKVNIPKHSDLILKKIYGDYMKLPPVNERESHNVKIVRCRDIVD